MMMMTERVCTQVAKLQRASLRDPVKVEVCNKYQTVDKLLQFYLFIPAREKVQVLHYFFSFCFCCLLLLLFQCFYAAGWMR